MPSVATDKACLNCGAGLRGRFCSECGQRDVPPQPTFRELLEEAWQGFTVFDRRLLATLGLLLWRPGALTLDVISGKRQRYIKPLRLYLIVSVMFFLLAAVAPPSPLARTSATMPGKDDITINILDPAPMSTAERDEALRSVDRAPRLLQPLFRRLILDPAGFRRNLFELLPRVVFALLPVFAAIVAAFYWRPFSLHLVFALHLFAAVFTVMMVRRLANFTGSVPFIALVEGAALVFVIVYSVRAFRTVYRSSWPTIIVKSVAIGVLYAAAAAVAMAIAAAIAASQS